LSPVTFETPIFLETHPANSLRGWADGASSGTHPSRAIIKHILPMSSDTEGRIGEALELPPLSDLAKESQTLPYVDGYPGEGFP